MGAQSHFLKNIIEYTEPIQPTEVPTYPPYQSKIIGMNYLDEIDDNLPSYIHPWMPSIKATKKRQEEEKALKVKEEEKDEQAAQGSSDEGGPSGGTPSDARGPDHQFPEKPDSDSDSCPPTPATPAIPPNQAKIAKSPLPPKAITAHVPNDKRKSVIH